MAVVVTVHGGGGATSASMNIPIGSQSTSLLRVGPQVRLPALAMADLAGTSCSSSQAWIGRVFSRRPSSIGSTSSSSSSSTSSASSSSSSSSSFIHSSSYPPPTLIHRHHHHQHQNHFHHSAGRNSVSSQQIKSAIDARATAAVPEHVAVPSIVELGECHAADDLRVSAGSDAESTCGGGNAVRGTAAATATAKPHVVVTRPLVQELNFVARVDSGNAASEGGKTMDRGRSESRRQPENTKRKIISRRREGNGYGSVGRSTSGGGGPAPARENPGFAPARENPGFAPARENPGFAPARENPGFAPTDALPSSFPSRLSRARHSATTSTCHQVDNDWPGDRLVNPAPAARSSSCSVVPLLGLEMNIEAQEPALVGARVEEAPAPAPFSTNRREEQTGEAEESRGRIIGMDATASVSVIANDSLRGSLSRGTSSSLSSASTSALEEGEEGGSKNERRKGGGRRWIGVNRMKKREPLPPWSPEYIRSKEEEMVKSILDMSAGDNDENGGDYVRRRKCHVESVLNAWLGKVTRVELINVAMELGRLHRADYSLDVFAWMATQKGRLKPNAHAYVSMIWFLGRSAMVEKAQELFEEMEEKGVERTAHAYNAMIGALIEGGRETDAWALFLRMRREAKKARDESRRAAIPAAAVGVNAECGAPNESLASSLNAKAEGKAGKSVGTDVESSSDELNRGESDAKRRRGGKCAPDCVTYNSILKYCANIRSRSENRDLRSQGGSSRIGGLSGKGHYNRERDWKDKTYGALWAIDLLRGMIEDGVEPNLITYNTVISACRHHGLYQQAMEIFRKMEEKGIRADVVTYNCLIGVCAKAKLCDKASDLFNLMKSAGVGPDLKTYTGLIGAYGSAGRPEDAQRVFDELVRVASTPSASTPSHPLAVGHMVESSLTPLPPPSGRGMAESRAESRATVVKPPDVVTWTMMVDAYGRAGMAEKAAHMFREMRANGIRPSLLTWTALMRAHGRVGDCDEATRVFNEMQRAGETVDVIGINVLLDAYGKNGRWRQASVVYNAVCSRLHASRTDNSSSNVLSHPNGTSRWTGSDSTSVEGTTHMVSSASSASSATCGSTSMLVMGMNPPSDCRVDVAAPLGDVVRSQANGRAGGSTVIDRETEVTIMNKHDHRGHGRVSQVISVPPSPVSSAYDRECPSSSSSSPPSSSPPSSSRDGAPTESALSRLRGSRLMPGDESEETCSARPIAQSPASEQRALGRNDVFPSNEDAMSADQSRGEGSPVAGAATARSGSSRPYISYSLGNLAADQVKEPTMVAEEAATLALVQEGKEEGEEEEEEEEEEEKGEKEDEEKGEEEEGKEDRDVEVVSIMYRRPKSSEEQGIGSEEDSLFSSRFLSQVSPASSSSLATSFSSAATESRCPSGNSIAPESGVARPTLSSWKVKPLVARVTARPNVATFNTMINTFHRGGRLEEALNVEKQMTACGCKPDHITLALLTRTLDDMGLHRRADELRKSVKKGRRKRQGSA